MYKGVIAALVPILASAQMSITTTEQVETVLKPDVLRGSLGFEEQGKNEKLIKEHLNAIIVQVKKQDPEAKMCQGGGYYLSPQYSYKDQKREFTGYAGTLNFGCEFKEIEPYNALLAAIDKVSAPSVRKNEGALVWDVSNAQERSAQGALRLELLRKAQEQAGAFSTETGMACTVSAVRFGGVPPVIPMMAKGMMMRESADTQSPIRQDKESTLDATVEYSCMPRIP